MTALPKIRGILGRLFFLSVVLVLCGCAAVRPRPLPPKVEVDTVSFAVAPVGEVRLRVSLDVTNPNAYDIPIASIDATFRLEDTVVATATLANPVTLPASGKTFVEIEARPDFAAMRQVMERVLRRMSAHYEVTGAAVVQNGVRLPFTKRGEVALADLLGNLR